MCDKIRQKIGDAFVDAIDMTDEKNNFQEVTFKATKSLVQGLLTKLEPIMITMTKMPWATIESVGDTNEYVNQFSNVVYQSAANYPIIYEI